MNRENFGDLRMLRMSREKKSFEKLKVLCHGSQNKRISITLKQSSLFESVCILLR
jgi:hypothetical protein